MKVSYKGDYALKTILHLALNHQSGSVVPLADIAAANDIPQKFLEQIMLVLKGAGFVESKRGLGGGFMLKKDPKEITVGDIVRIIDGATEPIACAKNPADVCCNEIETCVFREIWAKVATAISDVIDRVTFADLMCRKDELEEQSKGYTYQI
jgi:Rrf2 family cysteine metabolism transcriptional repressor